MAYFKVVLRGGHVGAGKSYDFVRYFQAEDMLSAFMEAGSLSRVKKNGRKTGICSVETISPEEYLRGKRRERDDPYLHGRRA